MRCPAISSRWTPYRDETLYLDPDTTHWHAGFGDRPNHSCMNLAPLDIGPTTALLLQEIRLLVEPKARQIRYDYGRKELSLAMALA